MRIDGRCLTRREFEQHAAHLDRGRPRDIYLHHTWIPRLDQWQGRETILGMKAWYEKQPWVDSQGREHIGWTAGPHLFVAPDGIWLFTPLDQDGVHAKGHNVGTIGIEMVGDYDGRKPTGAVLHNTLDALAALFDKWGMQADELMFHRDVSAKTCPGSQTSKARIVALLRKRLHRRKGQRGSRITVHTHKPWHHPWLKGDVAQMDPEFVKIMDPDQGQAEPYGDHLLYVGRYYFAGDHDKRLIARGAQGADEYWTMLKPRLDQTPWVSIAEGPNEPDVSNRQAVEHLAAFWMRLLDRAEAEGNVAMLPFSISTWNPPNMGEAWSILAPVVARAGMVSVHEYAMTPQLAVDKQNLGRLLEADRILRNHGVVAEWAVTETGLDRGGGKETDGYRARGVSAQALVDGLARYERRLIDELQGRLMFLSPFTWTTPDWTSFLIDEAASRHFVEYVASTRSMDLAPILAEKMQRHVIPQNVGAAFYRVGRDHGWEPISREHDIEVNGTAYRCQVWYDPAEQTQHVLYAKVGDWANIEHYERNN